MQDWVWTVVGSFCMLFLIWAVETQEDELECVASHLNAGSAHRVIAEKCEIKGFVVKGEE